METVAPFQIRVIEYRAHTYNINSMRFLSIWLVYALENDAIWILGGPLSVCLCVCIIGAPHICVLIYVHLCTDLLHYVHTKGPPSIILCGPPSKV